MGSIPLNRLPQADVERRGRTEAGLCAFVVDPLGASFPRLPIQWLFMMFPAVKSVEGVAIRLTDERWLHISEEHSEMAGYATDVLEVLERPDAVFAGSAGELLAARAIEPGKYPVVVYREKTPDDGFVVTAFLTRRFRQLARREQVWPR
jgi:hypothetical protein